MVDVFASPKVDVITAPIVIGENDTTYSKSSYAVMADSVMRYEYNRIRDWQSFYFFVSHFSICFVFLYSCKSRMIAWNILHTDIHDLGL